MVFSSLLSFVFDGQVFLFLKFNVVLLTSDWLLILETGLERSSSLQDNWNEQCMLFLSTSIFMLYLYSVSFSLIEYNFSAMTLLFLESVKVYCIGVIYFFIQWGIVLLTFNCLKVRKTFSKDFTYTNSRVLISKSVISSKLLIIFRNNSECVFKIRIQPLKQKITIVWRFRPFFFWYLLREFMRNTYIEILPAT